MGQSQKPAVPARRKRGFERTASLVSSQIRSAGESRGFAVSRLLTHWEEVVGADIARAARPVKVGYGHKGFGATLTVLVPGALAPMIEMQKKTILDKVNACYGYAAISRIHLTQTAPTGFAEPQAAFDPAPADRPKSPQIQKAVADMSRGVTDEGLRAALEMLGQNVLTKTKSQGRQR